MPACCSVPNCRIRGKKLSVFSMKCDNRSTKWPAAIQKVYSEYKFEDSFRVCEKHFKSDDFLPIQSKSEETKSGRRELKRLKKGAIPSIFRNNESGQGCPDNAEIREEEVCEPSPKKKFKKTATEVKFSACDVIEPKNKNQNTPLHLAVLNGHTEMCSVILKKGANPNQQNCEGHTPLHLATQKGHSNICQLLLDNDADIEATDHEGNTALHVAASCGHTDIYDLLLNQGKRKTRWKGKQDKRKYTKTKLSTKMGVHKMAGMAGDSEAEILSQNETSN